MKNREWLSHRVIAYQKVDDRPVVRRQTRCCHHNAGHVMIRLLLVPDLGTEVASGYLG
jgi:hypothetical protein